MTQDEIIRMAVECQLLTTSPRDGLYAQALEAFAKLVAAKEREACAKVAESQMFCSCCWPDNASEIAKACAEAIRERGEA